MTHFPTDDVLGTRRHPSPTAQTALMDLWREVHKMRDESGERQYDLSLTQATRIVASREYDAYTRVLKLIDKRATEAGE